MTLWLQAEGEPDRAYATFCVYRDLPPHGRSLAKVAEPTLDDALHDPVLFAEYIAPYATLVDDNPRLERRPATAADEAELERLRAKFPEIALGGA